MRIIRDYVVATHNEIKQKFTDEVIGICCISVTQLM